MLAFSLARDGGMFSLKTMGILLNSFSRSNFKDPPTCTSLTTPHSSIYPFTQ